MKDTAVKLFIVVIQEMKRIRDRLGGCQGAKLGRAPNSYPVRPYHMGDPEGGSGSLVAGCKVCLSC